MLTCLCSAYWWEMEHWQATACGYIIIIQLLPVSAWDEGHVECKALGDQVAGAITVILKIVVLANCSEVFK